MAENQSLPDSSQPGANSLSSLEEGSVNESNNATAISPRRRSGAWSKLRSAMQSLKTFPDDLLEKPKNPSSMNSLSYAVPGLSQTRTSVSAFPWTPKTQNPVSQVISSSTSTITSPASAQTQVPPYAGTQDGSKPVPVSPTSEPDVSHEKSGSLHSLDQIFSTVSTTSERSLNESYNSPTGSLSPSSPTNPSSLSSTTSQQQQQQQHPIQQPGVTSTSSAVIGDPPPLSQSKSPLNEFDSASKSPSNDDGNKNTSMSVHEAHNGTTVLQGTNSVSPAMQPGSVDAASFGDHPASSAENEDFGSQSTSKINGGAPDVFPLFESGQEEEATSPFQFSLLWLKFRDPILETHFKASHYSDGLTRMNLGLLVYLLVSLAQLVGAPWVYGLRVEDAPAGTTSNPTAAAIASILKLVTVLTASVMFFCAKRYPLIMFRWMDLLLGGFWYGLVMAYFAEAVLYQVPLSTTLGVDVALVVTLSAIFPLVWRITLPGTLIVIAGVWLNPNALDGETKWLTLALYSIGWVIPSISLRFSESSERRRFMGQLSRQSEVLTLAQLLLNVLPYTVTKQLIQDYDSLLQELMPVANNDAQDALEEEQEAEDSPESMSYTDHWGGFAGSKPKRPGRSPRTDVSPQGGAGQRLPTTPDGRSLRQYSDTVTFRGGESVSKRTFGRRRSVSVGTISRIPSTSRVVSRPQADMVSKASGSSLDDVASDGGMSASSRLAKVTRSGSPSSMHLSSLPHSTLHDDAVSSPGLSMRNTAGGQMSVEPESDSIQVQLVSFASMFDSTCVMFLKLFGLPDISDDPAYHVRLLNDVFVMLDDLTGEFGVEKIKTIGTAYMVAAGVPDYHPKPADALLAFGIAAFATVEFFSRKLETPLQLRVGVAVGPLVGGVIGSGHNLAYDVWGHTCNFASRMESTGVIGLIQVTPQVAERVSEAWNFSQRGEVFVKGVGHVHPLLLDPLVTWKQLIEHGAPARISSKTVSPQSSSSGPGLQSPTLAPAGSQLAPASLGMRRPSAMSTNLRRASIASSTPINSPKASAARRRSIAGDPAARTTAVAAIHSMVSGSDLSPFTASRSPLPPVHGVSLEHSSSTDSVAKLRDFLLDATASAAAESSSVRAVRSRRGSVMSIRSGSSGPSSFGIQTGTISEDRISQHLGAEPSAVSKVMAAGMERTMSTRSLFLAPIPDWLKNQANGGHKRPQVNLGVLIPDNGKADEMLKSDASGTRQRPAGSVSSSTSTTASRGPSTIDGKTAGDDGSAHGKETEVEGGNAGSGKDEEDLDWLRKEASAVDPDLFLHPWSLSFLDDTLGELFWIQTPLNRAVYALHALVVLAIISLLLIGNVWNVPALQPEMELDFGLGGDVPDVTLLISLVVMLVVAQTPPTLYMLAPSVLALYRKPIMMSTYVTVGIIPLLLISSMTVDWGLGLALYLTNQLLRFPTANGRWAVSGPTDVFFTLWGISTPGSNGTRLIIILTTLLVSAMVYSSEQSEKVFFFTRLWLTGARVRNRQLLGQVLPEPIVQLAARKAQADFGFGQQGADSSKGGKRLPGMGNGEMLMSDDPSAPIMMAVPSCSVVMADIVSFTDWSSQLDPSRLVVILNDLYSRFDSLTGKFGVTRVKTLGDAYIACCGVFQGTEDHRDRLADFVLEMRHQIAAVNFEHSQTLEMRFGLAEGPVVAGVIGKLKFSFDIWGHTMGAATKMEENSLPSRIRMTAGFAQKLDRSQFITSDVMDGSGDAWLEMKTDAVCVRVPRNILQVEWQRQSGRTSLPSNVASTVT